MEEKKRVELFIIGASKAGTTSICSLLDSHPGLTLSNPKEPCFFSARSYRDEPASFAAYHRCFKGPKDTMWLDGSTTYTRTTQPKYHGAAARIASYNPDARLIYVVRHPMERIESLWIQHCSERKTKMSRDFNHAVRAFSDAFIDGTNYSLQLEAYRQHFPDEQLHVAFFDDFRDDPDTFLGELQDFAGLERHTLVAEKVVWNSRASKVSDHPVLARLRTGRLGKSLALVRHVQPLYKVARWLRDSTAQKVETPTWSPEVRRWARDQLEEPITEFLETYGQGRIHWDLS